MMRLYFIAGQAEGPQGMRQFIVLAKAIREEDALGTCAEALNGWTRFHVDTIRPINPQDAYKVEPDLRDAIEAAQEHGHFLFLADMPAPH